jgi:RimJ/RimL family protein N-acetyltransferase
MPDAFELRPAVAADIPVFFQHLDDAAGGIGEDDTDARFTARWLAQLSNPEMRISTIVLPCGTIAGYVAVIPQDGTRSLAYRLGAGFRGRGLGSAAVAAFVQAVEARPLYARVAIDNAPSLRLLLRQGFVEVGRQPLRPDREEEFVLRLG